MRSPKNKKIKGRGFTLVEFLIYIGMVTFVLISSITFAWILINDQTKSESLAEVNDNGSFILNKISYYTKRVDTIDNQTIYDTNPGKLVLNYASNPQIIFDTYQKQVTLGDIAVNITKLRMKEGVNPAVDITSDRVDVTNFIITDFSKTGATTIKVDLTLETVNPSKSKAYEAQNSWTTSITIRK